MIELSKRIEMLDEIVPIATDRHIALLTTMPSDDAGTGLVELSSSDYARVAFGDWVENTEPGITVRSNVSAVEYAEALVEWSGIVGVAIYDDPSAGNLLWFEPFSNEFQIEIEEGTRAQFPPGWLEIGIRG